MKPAKLSFFSNIALIAITIILTIVALPLVWFGDSDGLFKCYITELKADIKIATTTTKLKDFCDTSNSNKLCKLSKASDTLITLSTFAMAALGCAAAIIILDLCCKMSKKKPLLFKIIYTITVIAGFVLYLVSFITYTSIASDFISDSDEKLKYKGGWIVYLISMIFSFFVFLLGGSNLFLKD